MRQILISLYALVVGFTENEEITCYECSYMEFENGTSTGSNNCSDVDINFTHTQTEKKFHGGNSDADAIMRMDCGHAKGTGVYTISVGGITSDTKFSFVQRFLFSNYVNTKTYEYDSDGVIGTTYSQDMHQCGNQNFQCNNPIHFPLPLQINLAARGDVECYRCNEDQFKDSNGNWVLTEGEAACASLEPLPSDRQPCDGLCIVDAKEMQFLGESIRKSVYRYCSIEHQDEPDYDMNLKIMSEETSICQQNLCNASNNDGKKIGVLYFVLLTTMLTF